MSIRVMGLDLSLENTGVCLPDGRTHSIRTDVKDGDARLITISRSVAYYLTVGHPDVAVIEATIGGHGFVTTLALADVRGVVKLKLAQRGVPCAFVYPSTLKKYATGHGAAKKPDMLDAAGKYASELLADHDQADAWWAWALGQHHYNGAPVSALHALSLPAAVKDWPKAPARRWDQ